MASHQDHPKWGASQVTGRMRKLNQREREWREGQESGIWLLGNTIFQGRAPVLLALPPRRAPIYLGVLKGMPINITPLLGPHLLSPWTDEMIFTGFLPPDTLLVSGRIALNASLIFPKSFNGWPVTARKSSSSLARQGKAFSTHPADLFSFLLGFGTVPNCILSLFHVINRLQ